MIMGRSVDPISHLQSQHSVPKTLLEGEVVRFSLRQHSVTKRRCPCDCEESDELPPVKQRIIYVKKSSCIQSMLNSNNNVIYLSTKKQHLSVTKLGTFRCLKSNILHSVNTKPTNITQVGNSEKNNWFKNCARSVDKDVHPEKAHKCSVVCTPCNVVLHRVDGHIDAASHLNAIHRRCVSLDHNYVKGYRANSKCERTL